MNGPLLMVAAMGCFALSDLLAKQLALAGHGTGALAAARYLCLLLLLAALALQRRRLPRTQRPGLQLLRALAVVSSGALFIAALQRLPVPTATALVFSSPLFVSLLSWAWLGEQVGAARWGWLGLGFAGVLVVARPVPGALQPAVLLPLASSLAWAVAMVATRRLGADDGSGRDDAFSTQCLSGAVGLAMLSPWLPELLPQAQAPLPAAQALTLIAMGLAWTAAQWLVSQAYAGAPGPVLAPFAYSQLLWALLLAVAVMGQRPDAHTLAGSALILLAGLGAARQVLRAG